MARVLNQNFKEGSRKFRKEPRLVGDIVKDMLLSNSKLAKSYRQYIASLENGEAEEPEWHANTELGCDVKTFLRSDKRMFVNKAYPGILRLDVDADIDELRCRDAHMTFIEVVRPTADKRNPHLFSGQFITVTRRDDGSLRLNFRPMPKGMGVDDYANGVCNEIREALTGLVESE